MRVGIGVAVVLLPKLCKGEKFNFATNFSRGSKIN